MYCPKCEAENPNDAQVCVNCSQPLSSVEAPLAVAAELPRTSGMAITSLVLGICGFCAGVFTALPAIVLGIISLVKVKNSNDQLKGSGLAIGGIVTASIALVLQIIMILLAILMPALAKTHSMASRIVCATNLSGLGKAMLIYSMDDPNERYPTPENWCDLLIKYADVGPDQFVCPSGKRAGDKSRSHYAINPKATPKSLPDTVMLFETTEGWNQSGGPELLSAENHKGDGANIAFCDFHVKFVKKEEFDNLRWGP